MAHSACIRWLAAGLALATLLPCKALAQEEVYNDRRAAYRELEMCPLPAVSRDEPDDDPMVVPVIPQRSEAFEKRLSDIEAAMKKEADAAQKKKEQDAKKPSIKLRGRIHADTSWISQDELNRATVGDIQDGVNLRRARIGVDVKAFEVTESRLEVDFAASGRPSFADAYGRVTELPYLGNAELGHFREPFSLEAQTSSNWFTFIERGLPNVFDPARNWGVMAFDHSEGESMTWAIGGFREGTDEFGSDVGDSGERAVTARITWLPFFDEPSDGRYLWHLGGSYSYRRPDEGRVRYAERPEDRIAEQPNPNAPPVGVPVFVDTGIVLADVVQLAGFETSWVYGPLCLQAEYIASFVDSPTDGNLFFHGAYAYASYFLTGESRRYDKKLGIWSRAEVFEPFFRVETDRGICTGSGAWEAAIRWSYLNLNDRPVQGGYLDDVTVGLNWYLNPYMRLMFNYVFADLNDPTLGESHAHEFLTRLDVNW